MQMVTLLRNPHILDQENIGKSLTPTISSLKFISGDKEMSIANLSNEDQMIIEIPNPTASMVSFFSEDLNLVEHANLDVIG